MPPNRIQGLAEGDEVAWDEPCPLMDQLVKRVLSVGARFAPVNGTGVAGDSFPIKRYVLSVALHRQLLEICREPLQILLIGQNADRLRAEEVVVPDREQSHNHRQIRLEG